MTVNTGAYFRVKAEVDGKPQVDALVDSVKKLGAAGQISAGQTAAAFRMLPAQFTDIATQLAGGQSPFMILLQQGGQIKDQFGGIGPMFRALASVLTPVRLVIGGIGAAVAVVGKAFLDGQDEVAKFNQQLALTGNLAGMNFDRFQRLAAQISATAGGSIGANKDLLMGAIGTGVFGQQSLEPAVSAMARYKDISGQTADAVVKDFAAMANGVASWAAAHNRAIGYLTLEQFKYIQQLERQGRVEEAMAENAKLLDKELELRKPKLNALGQLWKDVGEWASSAWDKMAGIGRSDPSLKVADEIASLERTLAGVDAMRAAAAKRGQTLPAESPELQAARQRLSDLQQSQREDKRLADKQAEINAKRRKDIEEEVSGLNDRKLQASLAQTLSTRQTAINEEIRQLEFQRAVVESYHQKEEISDQDYVRRITEIKQKEIDARKRLAQAKVAAEEGQPFKDAAQEMDKARKVAEAKAEVARLEKEGADAAKKAGLDIGVIDDRKSKALRYYIEDLAHQNDLLSLEADKVNLTDLQYRQLVESKQREYDIRVKTRGMMATEASEYRQAAESAGMLRDAIQKSNDAQTRTWQFGAKTALRAYSDEVMTAAKQTEQFMTNSLRATEDALVNFFMTGKLGFADLANSVIKDMIRIAVQRAILQPFASVIGTLLPFGSGSNYALPTAGGLTGGSTGLGLKMPSYAGGGFTGSGSRSGGLDGQGGFLAMLHPQESVMDHTMGQGAGGGNNVVVNVNVSDTGASQTSPQGGAAALGKAIAAAVQSELIRQKRPGGLLAA